MTMIDTRPAAAPDAAPRRCTGSPGVTRTYSQKDRIVKALAGVDLRSPRRLRHDPGAHRRRQVHAAPGAGRARPPHAGAGAPRRDRPRGPLRAAAARPRARREIGFVFQGFNLIPTLTAAENVDMALEPLGLPQGRARAPASPRPSRTSGLGRPRRTTGRASCSGGQQQRVAIARAIVKRPRVLLADEPTGNLDESMRDEILAGAAGPQRRGLTLIVVTHDSRGRATRAPAAASRAGRGARHHALTGGRAVSPPSGRGPRCDRTARRGPRRSAAPPSARRSGARMRRAPSSNVIVVRGTRAPAA